MSVQLSTEPGPPDPDDEERHGMALAILICLIFWTALIIFALTR